ncbi:helix-turn-helix domain-containing protein [Geobacter benzoatilyticus]|uniref:Helix-turn-helix domain-containing protein n=1 Tax=Geobacter benzoatilyticus TaxID=2815309 RepID=A0ABX7Q5A3_9BACT|nr:helix-turn-helix domain-containing protein [Geobacter benzoatilyticus]QSV46083.1 helix-turn-helix domain-containing protein [Geobacter benzoatilyticus]
MANKRLNNLERQQIAILAAQGITPHAMSKDLGRDEKTISKALKEPEVMVLVEEARGKLADVYESTARRMLASITDADILKINAYQRTVASGIATDKMRLLRGESTSNQSIFFRIVAEAPDLPPEEDEQASPK